MPVDPFLEPFLANYPQVLEVINDYPALVTTKAMASAWAWRQEILTALRCLHEQGEEAR